MPIFFSCTKKNTDLSRAPEMTGDLTDNNSIPGDNNVILSDSEESPLKIDYDLSQMNSNMVLAEVFNMMMEPEIYNNKTIKMRGNFTVYDNELTGKKAYAVIISDALACCQQGIEFEYDFSGNEPKEGEIVTVIGKYATITLKDDVSYSFVKAQSFEM